MDELYKEGKMKKTIMVLLVSLLLSALILTTCDNVLTKSSYSTTAEKMGINIPAVGITLDEFCQSKTNMIYAQMLEAGYIPVLYKDKALQNLFSGNDILYANTPIFSEVNLMSDIKTPIGEISGTITLSDVPNPAPKVYISVVNFDYGNFWGSSGSYQWWNDNTQINLSSGDYANISWMIPIYEDDCFSPSIGNFSLYVIVDEDINHSFNIDIPTTPYIGSVNTGRINLGTVSLKSITLSGTINITHNGQPIQHTSINARTTDGKLLSSTWLDSPTSTAPWSMMVSAINSDVIFGMSGCGNNEWYFYRDNLSQVSVYDQDKSGIFLNVGDIKTITLSGTISVTYNGKKVPNVSINSMIQDESIYDFFGSTNLSSPANGTSWSIMMEAPASTKTVYFNVTGGNKNIHGFIDGDGTFFYRKFLSPVSVYNQDISGIILNLGNITNHGKEDYDGDIAYYTHAIQIDTNSADTYHSRGFAYYNKGDYDLAINDYSQAIRIDSNRADTYNNRGASYNSKGDYDRAIVDLTEAIRIDPNFANPYRHRAFAYMKKGNYKQARTDVNTALQINPNYQSAKDLSDEIQRLGY
jgi:hypothetical protein